MKPVKGYIQRKTLLYKTGVEYGDYTMNHVLGCSHGCNYPCYAFLQKKRFGKVASYDEWIEPYLVSNALEILDREIPRLKAKIDSVHLCFTTDPFMYEYDEVGEMSLKAIRKLNEAGVICTVLTKGVLPSILTEYSDSNVYGITLASLDEGFRKEIEPGAASYIDRIGALKSLHEKGCKTWVSIEPYPTPNLIEQDLGIILDEIAFVDKIIFGRTNYSRVISEYTAHRKFYNEQAKIVVDFCQERGIEHHIKDGTIREI
jgi:DNA repair photolyase